MGKQHCITTISFAYENIIWCTSIHRRPNIWTQWRMFCCSLHQQTEFDCFIKSFTYLAARLPRSELLQPFLDDATVEPVESMKKQMSIYMKMREDHLSSGLGDFDAGAFMAGLQQVLGKPTEASEASLQVADLPLSEAEPDMYPCLLVMCGSGYGFFKVIICILIFAIVFCHRLSIITRESS